MSPLDIGQEAEVLGGTRTLGFGGLGQDGKGLLSNSPALGVGGDELAAEGWDRMQTSLRCRRLGPLPT